MNVILWLYDKRDLHQFSASGLNLVHIRDFKYYKNNCVYIFIFTYNLSTIKDL